MKPYPKTYKCSLCGHIDPWSCIWIKGIRMCRECYNKLKGGENGLSDLQKEEGIASPSDLGLHRP